MARAAPAQRLSIEPTSNLEIDAEDATWHSHCRQLVCSDSPRIPQMEFVMVRLVFALLVCVACGGVDNMPAPDTAPVEYPGGCDPSHCTPVSKALAGTWGGTASVFDADAEPIQYPATVKIGIFSGHPQSAWVRDICPDGSGYFVAGAIVGNAGRLEWVGDVQCFMRTPTCPERYMWLERASVILSSGTSIVVLTTGRMVGCGEPAPVSGVFFGQRIAQSSLIGDRTRLGR